MRKLSLVLSLPLILCGFMAAGGFAVEPATLDNPVAKSATVAETKLGKNLTSVEANTMLGQDTSVVIIDARPRPAYFYLGHAPGALSIPARFWTGKFDAEKSNFKFNRNTNFAADVSTRVADKSTPIIILATTGNIGVIAVNMLADGGYTNVYNVVDGFSGWQKSGLPLTRKIDPALLYIRD